MKPSDFRLYKYSESTTYCFIVCYRRKAEIRATFKFIVLMVRLERSFQQLEIRWPRWVAMVPGYVVGALGAFWTIQRTAMLFGGIR